MDCSSIRPLISSYYDGEASPEEETRVERHLESCADCRDLLAEYRLIGGGIRALAVPVPPAGLRRDVWSAIEADRRTTPDVQREPATITVLRGGKSSSEQLTNKTKSRGWGRALPAASLVAAMVLVLVGVLYLVNRSVAVQAASLREPSPVTQYASPVHVAFSKPVSKDKVEIYTSVRMLQAGSPITVTAVTKSYDVRNKLLTIAPASAWAPGATYEVYIDAPNIPLGALNAPLADKPLVLQFDTLANTPTPTSTPSVTLTSTPTRKPTNTLVPTQTPQPTAVAQNTEVLPPALTPTSASDTPTATRMPDTATATSTATASPSPRVTGTGTVTATVTVTPFHSVTATVTATPTRKPSQTATPRTTASTTPGPHITTTPRATVTATPQPCTTMPVNGFGKLWRDNAGVRTRMGCPTAAEFGLPSAAEQHFQGGYMLWRGDTKTIYVFLGTEGGTWYQYSDTWLDSEPTPVAGNPPAGFFEPVRGFGKLWRNNPGLRQSLGWATDRETATTAAWQTYSGGTMLWTGDRLIRVMYDDHTSELYHDTSPTPTPALSRPGDN